jgi:protein-S-isoprenylcysteine O-methyltransferase Ste14
MAGLLLTLIAMGLAIFLPAGTLHYWQAWSFLAVFAVLSLAITFYLMKHDPKLLERRLRGGPTAEKEPAQKIIQTITSTGFVAILVVSGLDHRWHWSSMPLYAAIAGDLLVVLGYAIIFFVFRENTFAASIIEVSPGQKVISTGPYAIVRHPMYGGAFFYLVGMPISLASLWGLAAILLMMPAFIWRIFNEERLLRNNLPGYAEYCRKVRYRLIPFVW